MKTLSICFLILTNSLTYSQNTIVEGNSIAGKGLWSVNASGYSHCDALSIGLSTENKWFLPELTHSIMVIAVPTDYGSVGITLSTIGDQLLNKNELTLSLARDFSSAFSIGLRTRYSLLQIDHQTKGWVEADIGAQIHFSNAVSVAFQLVNPLGNREQSKAIEIGLAYWVSDKVDLMVSAKKETQLPTSLILYLNYEVVKQLILQGAVSNTAYFSHFAVAYKWKSLALEAILSYHSYLGVGPRIGVCYTFQK